MFKLDYHIRVKKNDIGKYILLVGDPKRTQIIAKFFETPKEVFENREFRIITGYINTEKDKKIKVSTVSTGIGCPAAAICIEELATIGAKVFIRIGTAGSLQKYVKLNNIVISLASVREDGTSLQYVPLSYPACASIEVVNALVKAAEKLNIKYHIGITHCKDAFYSEIPEYLPLKEKHLFLWKVWQRSNVIATSMESSTLFVIGSIRKLFVGEILTIVGTTYSKELIIEKNVSFENAIKISIEAIKILYNKLKLS
ncbi:MAG: nucleoside phosphorylase [Endomicrobia bacterium]|nr:nucleoside phosphorylase [Endomicrobiia bacterium]